MCSTTLEKRTVKIVAKMFTWKTFDVTLLDSYFLDNEVKVDLVFSLHSYIYKTEWVQTFIFTDVFDIEFEKIAKMYKSLHATLFIAHSDTYQIDVMNRNNPIIFKDELLQLVFKKWLKWEY